MGVFKNYNGELLNVPDHKHSTTDTLRNNNIAIASEYDDGFMSHVDRLKLSSLKVKMDYLNEKMQSAVYLNDDIKS